MQLRGWCGKVEDGAKLLHNLRWCLKDEDGVISIGVFEDGVKELLTSKKVRLQFAQEKTRKTR